MYGWPVGITVAVRIPGVNDHRGKLVPVKRLGTYIRVRETSFLLAVLGIGGREAVSGASGVYCRGHWGQQQQLREVDRWREGSGSQLCDQLAGTWILVYETKRPSLRETSQLNS